MAVISGGDKLRKHLMELAVKLKKPATLNVGFMESKMATRAAFNEYGGEHRPPRPFFRNMIAEKSAGWGKNVGDLLKANDYDAPRALSLMGEEIAGQLRESIQNLTNPALSPSTVEAKGFAKPLIDTGDMLKSVDFEVKK